MAEHKAETTMEDVEKVFEETSGLISSQNLFGALKASVASPPQTKDTSIREKAAENVIRVLDLIKEKDIEKFTTDLSAEERDTVMKYVFKAMALGNNCGALLKWHEQLVKANGIGCILRSITDRKV